MRKRYYIGLATSPHDLAIAIIDNNGEVLFAEAAERYYQVKKAIGCPPDNFLWGEELINKYCTSDADYVISTSWSNTVGRTSSLLQALGVFKLLFKKNVQQILINSKGLLLNEYIDAVSLLKISAAVKINAGAGIEMAISNLPGNRTTKNTSYDHHLSHAGLACYAAPFDSGVCLVVDGSGESGSLSLYNYKAAKIKLLEKQTGSLSLGGFYARLTRLCGFDPIKGEEWKVMGLAAYGTFDEELHRLFKSMYYVRNCNLKAKKSFRPVADYFNKRTAADPENFSLRADIAYNGQLAYSEWMNELITHIHKKYPSDNLILTGGCALNSSHNGEILNKTPFKNLYIPSAPADDGCALGSALLAYYADNPHIESIHKNLSPYMGTEITDDQLRHFIRFSGLKVRKLEEDKYETVARLLADGKIIGWVQGKAEYGSRALGNRSIIADPRKKEIKDIINERVKFREEFRPFAPSILHEYGPEYFEHYQESHYMERTLTFKKESLDKVPGVVHVNNSGRLQSVKEEWNSGYYHLIKAFHTITGVPVLLNTSFNVMGKPIIHTVENALSTFFTTGIDALVINNYLIEK